MLKRGELSSFSVPRRLAAWAVHFFTATGAVWALLAIQAIFAARWREAFVWMIVAVVVDGVDGTFARWVKVRHVLPYFDGALLDNLTDYLNYVIVPALLLSRSELLPRSWGMPAAAVIALASGYQFCREDAKTPDHHFRGFPSYWNVAVFYLFVFGLSPWSNLAILAALTVLIFVPVKYVYPSRTDRLPRLTLSLTAIWGLLIVAMVATVPATPRWLVGGSLLYVVYYVALSLYDTLSHQTVVGRRGA